MISGECEEKKRRAMEMKWCFVSDARKLELILRSMLGPQQRHHSRLVICTCNRFVFVEKKSAVWLLSEDTTIV